ncbi:MAG: VOC family protein [Propionivibrio sp.]|uniref:VOC family protein n=1 Tax=Propionivibrio sp. TaxID=2212460 RepID=UPI001B5DCA5F|nr:VOC family protein [Propionivibrio sp.]MBP7203391.1 VOC family protein [Propionivibrio sp.]
MKQAISFVTLGVGDLARSRQFYAALGWKESSSSNADIAFFQAGSVAFALFQREALAEDADVAAQGSGFSGVTLAHNVESEEAVVNTIAEAVAAGATLVRPADKVFWGGFRGYFADPDGFLWEVCWNPFVTLDSEGHVQLPA